MLMNSLIIFIFLYISIPLKLYSIKGEQIKHITLVQYKNKLEMASYNITLINNNTNSLLSSKTSFSKLAYITDLNNTDQIIINKYSKYYNKYWIFYLNNTKELLNIIETKFKDISISAILIPSYLGYDVSKNKNYPIFEINSIYENDIISNDFRIIKKDIFFKLRLFRKYVIYPKGYLIAFSLILVLSSFIILGLWDRFTKNTPDQYIYTYHTTLKFLPFIQGMLSLILIFKTISINENEITIVNYEDGTYYYNDNDDENVMTVIEVVICIMNSIYRSVFWLFLMLFSFGWNISRLDLSREEYKKFSKFFLGIMVVFLLDDILDKNIEKIWIIFLSEIKNTFLYIIFLIFMLKFIKKNIFFLNRKYYYALLLVPDFANAIMFKITLMKKIRMIILFYYICYVIMFLINKIFLQDYESNFFSIVHYIIPYFICSFMFEILMRPRIMPDNFDVDLGDIFREQNWNSFKCKLPKYNLMDDISDNEDILNKDKLYKIEDKSRPILVIGYKKINGNLNNVNNYNINNSFIDNDLNKYFSGLHVGFCINGNEK